MAAIVAGELTSAEASDLSHMIEGYVRALEASEFDQRLRALEARGDATRP
jgi:hypothetical protein